MYVFMRACVCVGACVFDLVYVCAFVCVRGCVCECVCVGGGRGVRACVYV